MTFKTITLKKKGGGTRRQRVKILASGKYKFVKNPKKGAKSKSRSESTAKPKRRKKTVARKKRRSRRSRQMTVPLAVVVPAITPLAMPAMYGKSVIQWLMEGNWDQALKSLAYRYAGINPEAGGQIMWEELIATYAPMVAGTLVHKFVGGPPLNLNKTLARYGVPFLRI